MWKTSPWLPSVINWSITPKQCGELWVVTLYSKELHLNVDYGPYDSLNEAQLHMLTIERTVRALYTSFGYGRKDGNQ